MIIKDKIKGIIGSALIKFMPREVNSIKQGSFSLSEKEKNVFSRLIRFRLAQRAIEKNDYETLSTYHKNFWSGKNAKSFHDNTTERFNAVFLKYNIDVIEVLEKLLKKERSIDTLCEIGTGSGQVLLYLSNRLPGIKRFVGIDLCKEKVEELNKVNQDARIEFICQNALSWIKEQGTKNTIFLTNMGVLEYFTQNEVEDLVGHIAAQLHPSFFVAIEPVAVEHDLKREHKSQCFGGEYSFSHNYPYLFETSGFSIKFLNEIDIFPYRILRICAVSEDMPEDKATSLL